MHRGTCTVYRMPTQKRRVVYMSDEAWESAKRQAKPHGLTVSAYIQGLVIGGAVVPAVLRDPELRRDMRTQAAKVMTQAQRDAILRRISKH